MLVHDSEKVKYTIVRSDLLPIDPINIAN
jgi:hypothetical protein